MRITNVPRPYEVYGANKTEAAPRPGKSGEKRDVLALSEQAKDFSAVMKAVSETPDIRTDKVESIKARIESGTYNVSGADVANKIISKITNA